MIFKVAFSFLEGCCCESSGPLHSRELIRVRDDIVFSGQSFQLQAIAAALVHAAPEAIARSTADDLLLRFLSKQCSSEYLKLGADQTYHRCCAPFGNPLDLCWWGAPSEESGAFECRGGAKVTAAPPGCPREAAPSIVCSTIADFSTGPHQFSRRRIFARKRFCRVGPGVPPK